MTPAGRRDKGATGEREVIKLLEDELGLKLTRNPLQSHRGGRDVIEDIEQMQKPIPFAIEVKRQEAEALAKWWSQTCLQGEKPWNVVVEAHYVNPVIWPVRRREGIMMAVPTAIQWMREKLNGA
jgi:hypothetical protein